MNCPRVIKCDFKILFSKLFKLFFLFHIFKLYYYLSKQINLFNYNIIQIILLTIKRAILNIMKEVVYDIIYYLSLSYYTLYSLSNMHNMLLL